MQTFASAPARRRRRGFGGLASALLLVSASAVLAAPPASAHPKCDHLPPGEPPPPACTPKPHPRPPAAPAVAVWKVDKDHPHGVRISGYADLSPGDAARIGDYGTYPDGYRIHLDCGASSFAQAAMVDDRGGKLLSFHTHVDSVRAGDTCRAYLETPADRRAEIVVQGPVARQPDGLLDWWADMRIVPR